MSTLNQVKCQGTLFPFLQERDNHIEPNRYLGKDPIFRQKWTQTVFDWENLKPFLSVQSSILVRWSWSCLSMILHVFCSI